MQSNNSVNNKSFFSSVFLLNYLDFVSVVSVVDSVEGADMRRPLGDWRQTEGRGHLSAGAEEELLVVVVEGTESMVVHAKWRKQIHISIEKGL
jgi:hypothetical protein